MFVNEELGLSFPFPLPPMGQGSGGLGDLKFVRIAFPKYLERKPYFRSGDLLVNDKSYPLEVAENINEIAFKTLEDRMLRELATSLMRLALKQAAEYQVRKQNENLGALVSLLNAVSEKADTEIGKHSHIAFPIPGYRLKQEIINSQLKTYTQKKIAIM